MGCRDGCGCQLLLLTDGGGKLRLHLCKPTGHLPLDQLCNLILEVLIHVVKQN